jgi:hypothetical protein
MEVNESRTQRAIAAVTGLVLVALLSLAAQFLYQIPPRTTLTFTLAVLVLFYLPGSLLFSGFAIRCEVYAGRFFLSLALGTVTVPVLYLFARRFGTPDLLTASFFAACAIAWAVKALRGREQGPRAGSLRERAGLLTGLLVVCILLHFSHFGDILLKDQGFDLRTTFMTESVFHQGVVNALRDSFPPPALYASGGPDFSHYHLNMHLQMELIHRFFGIDTLKLVFFGFPFLCFTLLFAVPYVFVRQSGGSPITATTAGLLVFCADLSFIPGLLAAGGDGQAWVLFFDPAIWSFFTLNGLLPASVTFFLFIYCLRDCFDHMRHRALVLLVLLAFAAFGYKSTMGLQTAGIMLLLGVLMTQFEDSKPAALTFLAASVAAMALMFIDLAVFRSGAGGFPLSVAPLNEFRGVLDRIGLAGMPGMFDLPVYILVAAAALGVRVLGFAALGRYIRRGRQPDWVVVFLAVFVLSGYLLADLVFIGYPGEDNHAAWFASQSLIAAWALLYLFLLGLEGRVRNFPAILVLVALFAVPSTLQFLNLRAGESYIEIGADEMEVVRFFDGVAPGSVVLHPINQSGPDLASNLAGRSSVLNVYRSFVTEHDGLSERARDVMLFFSGEASPEQRTSILDKYQVDYIWAPGGFDPFLVQQPGVVRLLGNPTYSVHGTGAG